MEVIDKTSFAIHEILPYIEKTVQGQIDGKEVSVPYLVGTPGNGKTSVLEHYFTIRGWNVMLTHFGLVPYEDISGLIDFVDVEVGNDESYKGSEWRLPDLLTKVYRMARSEPESAVI